MNRLISHALMGLLLSVPASVCAEAVRFLVVGDSWAEEQWLDGSHQRVFSARGLGLVGVSGDLTTTSGSTAADWVMPVNLERISNALNRDPHIDTVQLTVGGNDFLDAWNTGLDAAAFDQLVGWIRSDIEVITDFILNQRPGIEIVLSLYDYPNFEDTRNGLIWTFACSGLWSNLGNPSALEVNTAAVAVIDAIETLADGDPRIQHVRHLGQAQNFFGLPGQPPGTIAPPGQIGQPSPAAAMRERFLFGGLDCFHFNADAYDVLIGNLVEAGLAARFADGLSLSLEQASTVYSGQAQPAVVVASPDPAALIVTYDGEQTPPVDAGSYALVATAPGWRAVLKTDYQILQAVQGIDFEAPETLFADTGPMPLTASADSGLAVDLTLISGPASLTNGLLVLNGQPGVIRIEASQAGDDNWLAADTIERSILVIEREDELFDDRFELDE